ncbi:protein FAR1-RELATED SEQUENCE 5-like [Olea europaea var. sylvestris]|uniref:protein FAR1-RELATED SEQUENCE 5-like n=1 Tax=Olea europaea var. sylvestris TaxID=158386 RepID=UPI000C1D2735|nr:protein FAR1-RELATED SEQUENCE 5-like [Olea europaea var. sylvestris]
MMRDRNDVPMVQSENEIFVDSSNIVGNESLGGDGELLPEVGMTFASETELFDFYKRYAYAVGFPVRRRNSKKDDDGVVRYVTFTCGSEGRRSNNSTTVLKPQPTSQIDCKTRISASVDVLGKWRINTVNLKHNHKTSPSKSRLYRCNRELSAIVKRKLEVNDVAGIPLHKSFNSTVVEAGGYENMTYVERDCRNYIKRVRILRLGKGDAAALQSYFSKMQSQCSGFYFSMNLDDEGRLKNVFWADNRSRQAYKEFGDVVTFDTTYLMNKYNMSFTPFVGVNHHGQSTLLSCDKAMQNAIAIVFPNAKHRWCLWHIIKKLPEKFRYHNDKSSIFSCMHDLVYDSQREDEFENG